MAVLASLELVHDHGIDASCMRDGDIVRIFVAFVQQALEANVRSWLNGIDEVGRLFLSEGSMFGGINAATEERGGKHYGS